MAKPKPKPKIVVDSVGTRWWYLGNQLHREDGPAIEWIDGTVSWFLHHKGYALYEYIALIDMSEEDKLLLTLKYAL